MLSRPRRRRPRPAVPFPWSISTACGWTARLGRSQALARNPDARAAQAPDPRSVGHPVIAAVQRDQTIAALDRRLELNAGRKSSIGEAAMAGVENARLLLTRPSPNGPAYPRYPRASYRTRMSRPARIPASAAPILRSALCVFGGYPRAKPDIQSRGMDNFEDTPPIDPFSPARRRGSALCVFVCYACPAARRRDDGSPIRG